MSTTEKPKPVLIQKPYAVFEEFYNGKKEYQIADGTKDLKNPAWLKMRSALGTTEIEPAEAIALLRGGVVSAEVAGAGESEPYTVHIFAAERTQKNWVVVESAVPIFKRETSDIVGYRLPHPERTKDNKLPRVAVFSTVGQKDDPERTVRLTLPEMFQLLRGKAVEKQGLGKVTLDEIHKEERDGRCQYTARLSADWVQVQRPDFTFDEEPEQQKEEKARAGRR